MRNSDSSGSMRLGIAAAVLTSLGFVASIHAAGAATLSNREVDKYNVRVGTQTFAGLYQFTTNTLLVETAQAIQGFGSDIIKMYHGPAYSRQYRIALPSNVTNLQTLARDEPSCRRVLDMPFRHYIMWAYPFSNPDAAWVNGYSSSERANDYREIYDLTRYLLTQYNNSGKDFYLGHWEGDWYLLPNYNTTTNPTPTAIQGMIDWLNNRQKAVDDAKNASSFSNVNVFSYAEVNRVRDAMGTDTNSNQRAINKVVPYVTNLDYVSWSSYDGMNLSAADLTATLNYMDSMLPTNKATKISGKRIFIGEYGWGGNSTDSQEPLTRSYIQRLLPWGSPFILFWEIYNNETNRNFCLIDSNNVKVPSWYLHQRFVNRARMLSAQFLETNGRLPDDTEFSAFMAPLLNQPLPVPVRMSVSAGTGRMLQPSVAQISCTLTQGTYGDDCAAVLAYWGRVDGGTSPAAWEGSRWLGLNTNFNPATFSCVLSNLAPDTNYFFRFSATNSAGRTWAPTSGSLNTTALDPAAFGCRLKLVFSGYTRTETLDNFPVLVSLGASLPGFGYSQFASPTGGDLRFTDASGLVPIPHEFDEWNTNGNSLVWVRVPQLAGTNDFIWAYWGNPLATNLVATSTNGGVWSNAFELVWHLKESSFPYSDSTLRHPATTGNAPLTTPSGRVGRAAVFDGATDFLNAGTINLGDRFTLSAWVYEDPSASDIQSIWVNKASGSPTAGMALFLNSWKTQDQKVLFETGNGTYGATAVTETNTLAPGAWHHVAAVVDRAAGRATLYVDGVDRTSQSGVRTDFANQAGLVLGCFTNRLYFFKGAIDEARVETDARSSSWVWASWATAAPGQNFLTSSTVSRVQPVLSAGLGAGGLVFSWAATGVGYALARATNLTPPIVWTVLTNRARLVGNEWQVTADTGTGAASFYRLQGQ